MAKEQTWGYHADCPGGKIFEIDRDAGETLPAGWVDTPAKLAPKSPETTATDPPVLVAAPEAHTTSEAARIDELAAELAALKDVVKTLQHSAPKANRRGRRAAKRRAQQETAATGAQPGSSETAEVADG